MEPVVLVQWDHLCLCQTKSGILSVNKTPIWLLSYILQIKHLHGKRVLKPGYLKEGNIFPYYTFIVLIEDAAETD